MIKLHGLQGRITAGIAALAGALTALTEAAQAANLISIVPERYRPILPTVTILALMLTVFAERVQGGASRPEVREQAARADLNVELKRINK